MDAETATDVARHRSSQQHLLRKAFKGDLDWIVMKALEKDRGRRYETANGLARDVERFLANEDVTASPPTLTYRLFKFYSRHRAMFWVGAAFAATLVIATFVSFSGWIRAFNNAQELTRAVHALREANALAEDNAVRAMQSEDKAKSERASALRQQNIVEAVNEFLNQEFLLAVAPSNELGRGKDAKLKDTISMAVKKLDEESRSGGRFANEPLVEAQIRKSIGTAFSELGEFDFAEKQLRIARDLYQSALPDDDAAVFDVKLRIGENLLWRNDRDPAKKYLSELKDEVTESLGPSHPIALWTRFWFAYVNRGSEAGAEFLDIAANAEKLGSKELHCLALAAAATVFTRTPSYALELVKQSEDTNDSDGNRSTLSRAILNWQRAYTYFSVGNYEQGTAICESLLPWLRESLGVNHRVTRSCLNNVGYGLRQLGQLERAKKYLIELEGLANDGDTTSLRNARINLGRILLLQQNYQESAQKYLENYRELGDNQGLISALQVLRQGGYDREAADLIRAETESKIERIKRGGLNDREFAQSLLDLTSDLNRAGEFTAALTIAQTVNDTIDVVADYRPTNRYVWLLNLGKAELFLGEANRDSDQLKRTMKTLENADDLATREIQINGLKNFRGINDPVQAIFLLARACMNDQIGDLQRAESTMLEAQLRFAQSVHLGQPGNMTAAREFDRLMLLSERSRGDVQRRFVAQTKKAIETDPDNAAAALMMAVHLYFFGEAEQTLGILNTFDWKSALPIRATKPSCMRWS